MSQERHKNLFETLGTASKMEQQMTVFIVGNLFSYFLFTENCLEKLIRGNMKQVLYRVSTHISHNLAIYVHGKMSRQPLMKTTNTNTGNT